MFYNNPAYDKLQEEKMSDESEQNFIKEILQIENELDKLNQKKAVSEELHFNPYREKSAKDTSKKRNSPTDNVETKSPKLLKIAMLQEYEGKNNDISKVSSSFFDEFKLNQYDIEFKSSDDANSALINYFIHLCLKEEEEAYFDYKFIDHVLKQGDVNVVDKYGQSLMHEVAREWNTDVAVYLKSKGANIDIPDNWGRTPLFVAASSNHYKMVEWLIHNGANMFHRSLKGEGQMPIHFAAKSGSVDAFNILVKNGANPLEKDERNRCPFYLAAERGLEGMCLHLLDLDLPVASYCTTGSSTIDLIVEKLPSFVGRLALDQFVRKDGLVQYYYISCLGKRRWRNLNADRGLKFNPPTFLQILIDQQDLSLITHPVTLQFLEVKRKFSKIYVYLNIFCYLLFTILWTFSASIPLPKDYSVVHTNQLSSKSIIIISALGQLLTFIFMVKFYLEYSVSLKWNQKYKKSKLFELELDAPFCHPAWPLEVISLKNNIEILGRRSSKFFTKGWNVIEAFCLLMATIQMILNIYWYCKPENSSVFSTRMYFSAIFIVITWLRLNRALSTLQWLGPFIDMLGECAIASARFGFLYTEFYVPFAVMFWVIFGRSGGEYNTFNDLLYQLFLLLFVGNYDYDTLSGVNKLYARLAVSAYFILVSIISLNLYIALLSEAFGRVNDRSSATVSLKSAMEYDTYDWLVPKLEEKFEIYINKYCAPMRVKKNRISKASSSQSVLVETGRKMLEVLNILVRIEDDSKTSNKKLEIFKEQVENSKKHLHKKSVISNQIREIEDFQSLPITKVHKKTRTMLKSLMKTSKST